jgi:2-hydroxychromene-2-carboxylate isomerase
MPTRPTQQTDQIISATDVGPKLEFWFDFASTYAYLSAMRVKSLAKAAGVTVEWRPFLLGPIFAAQGWSTSPFNLFPAKGRYMIRDLERLSAERGLVFHSPTPFPQHSVMPARIAHVGMSEGWADDFSQAVFDGQFARGMQLTDRVALAQILDSIGLDSARIIYLSDTPAIKDALRQSTVAAQKFGIFGAPTFRTSDGEIYWGDDRLEHAIRAAAFL